ncbi:MAG TPA: GNAT family N-acetyltransferase [Acidimicrobiia bacterium]|jgi:hypothetical protein
MELRHEPDNHRYVAEIDGEIVGVAVYHLRNERHIFVHTEVDPAHKRAGVGSALARYALDDVKTNGGTVVPVCPFIASWIRRHPEYDTLVDHELLDRINGVTSDR